MMKWGMEILSPQSHHHHLSNSNWLLEDTKSTKWTHEENKRFENALALYDKETPDRWQKVAAMIPGKTVMDVMKQYKELEDDVNYIEAGLVPIPGYTTSSFTLDWVNGRGCFDGSGGKRSSNRPTDQERKKGVPWTEDEHRQFLLGLRKYGKGDWRNISRNFVISRTPTQVASHAQKYFIRQLSGGKDKRRSSIHDITTVNLTDIRPSSPDSNNTSSLDQSSMLSQQHNPNSTPKALFDWNQTQDGSTMSFNPAHGNLFVPPPYGMNSYGRQGLHRGSLHMGAHHNTVFQMQSSQCHPRG